MSTSINLNQIQEWNKALEGKHPQDIIEWTIERFQKKRQQSVGFACSFSVEDTVLLHMISSLCKEAPCKDVPKEIPKDVPKEVRIFLLDTGRLHEKTYETLESCRVRYKATIDTYFPDASDVEELVRSKGAFSFYETLENRKECCFIRKVKPLRRALSGLDAWFTGLRQQQSITRTETKICEIDTNHNHTMIKVSPLLHWNWEQVIAFAKENKVPVHPLHSQGYPSIGCEPCTRAISEKENFRSGRWWWETAENSECGLHKAENGK